MKHRNDASSTVGDAAEGQSVERRRFFKLVGLGALAGAAAAAAPGAVSAATAEPDAKSLGYQETAHVKTYYELARF
ncbi:MAG: formate dehydrogenase [Proteobacteria bacterium]|nr:formate dehydrogenase [Pseudomonadota bacterium]